MVRLGKEMDPYCYMGGATLNTSVYQQDSSLIAILCKAYIQYTYNNITYMD